MTPRQTIALLKFEDRMQAEQSAIALRSDTGGIIGRLVPIGPWALDDDHLIASFTQWRRLFMRFFQSQFKASQDSMRNYLETLSIGRPDRIFFAIYHNEAGLVGHIGLSNVTEDEAELDNIIRGVSGGEPKLMQIAEETLLAWAFGTLGVARITAEVLSFNFMAHDLHRSFGFRLVASEPLLKIKQEDVVTHRRVSVEKANVDYKLDTIALTASDFENRA